MATDVHSMNGSSGSPKPNQLPLPRGLGLVTSVGPGLVLAMSFLGTGDLVSSSVSGASYGYALLWTLVLSLIARTFIISSIAKYTLMNRHGDTQILDGFARLAPVLPGIMAAVVIVAGFITQATFVLAASTGLHELTGGQWGGGWGRFFCAIIIVALTLSLVMLRKQFVVLEYFARFASVAMIIAFVYALIKIGTFDIGGFMQGLAFEIPEEQNTSAFAPIVIASATIGTIAGNMPNLLYSGFMRDKGWVGPKYRRLQQFDLIAGMAPLLVINLLFWIVAAEFRAAHPGFSIADEFDLSHMLSVAVGPAGPFLLWMCIFFAAMTSFPRSLVGSRSSRSTASTILCPRCGSSWAEMRRTLRSGGFRPSSSSSSPWSRPFRAHRISSHSTSSAPQSRRCSACRSSSSAFCS